MDDVGVAAAARVTPDKDALVSGEERITFAQLDARANQAARALAAQGAGPNGRVAIAFANRPESFEASVAAARLGAEVVPVPWRASAAEVRRYVEDSAAAVLLTEASGGVSLDEYRALRDAESTEPIDGAIEPAAVRFRYYTSGTTGRPKAVERPDGGPEGAVAGVTRVGSFWGIDRRDDVHLVCGPLYHTAPCAYAGFALFFGQTVVIMDRFDARTCLRLIQDEQVTWTHMVPINFIRILALEGADRFDLSSLRLVLHAAAPCPVEVKRRIMTLFGPDVVWEYYGMTEAFATVIPPAEWRAKPGSVGRAAMGSTVTIRDEHGSVCPAGETGLVYVKPVAKFRYGGDEAKTKETWRGEEFTVGDMGYLDEDGYLYLTDRMQDMIITGGANVYPAEVEAVLFEHPAVADVAVIGIPDDEWGEAVHAVVQARSDVDPSELIRFSRERLAHYKCPRSVELVESLPRDDNGKVPKRALREPYWAGRDRRI